MQNYVNDSLKLNKFVHVSLPQNSRLFLRVEGRSLPSVSDNVDVVDYTNRKLDKLLQTEADFIHQYQDEMNRLDREDAERLANIRQEQSVDSSKA